MDLWRNLSYKKRNQLLWLGGVLFLFLAYQLAFSKTIHAYKSYRYYQSNVARSGKLRQERARLQTRLQELDHLFTSSGDSILFRETILARISEFAGKNDLLVTAVPAITNFKNNDDLTIFSASFYIEGRFADLLRLTAEIENHLHSARISSATFSLKKSGSGKPLTVILELQMISIVARET